MSKDTDKYEYSYSYVRMKTGVNGGTSPRSFTPLVSRKRARKKTLGYEKIQELCSSEPIDENTVKKTNLYKKEIVFSHYWVGFDGKIVKRSNENGFPQHYWLETSYTRTRKLKA